MAYKKTRTNMAKAELEYPFNSISGKLAKDSEMYFTQRFGETVVSNYPRHKDPAKITDKQKVRYAVFQQAVAQADAILHDPEQKQEWQARFEEQKRTAQKPYKQLRNFIIATITKQL